MKHSLFRISIISFLALCLSACAMLYGSDGRRGTSSSLVDYLYPQGEIPPKFEGKMPRLQLPLTVGLAFVPSKNYGYRPITEALKSQLLSQVKQQFEHLDYVKHIEIIPEAYMRSSKGFEGVDQLARLYGLDVVALVSYDQVSVSEERTSALTYWTIVGAYLIRGNQNTATTFVDTAVFDVASRKMLFRAPGVSEIKKSSTLVEVDQVNRELSAKGFSVAMDDMSKNLAAELEQFKSRIADDKSVEISHREGYGGGGALSWPWLLIFAILGLLKIRRISR